MIKYFVGLNRMLVELKLRWNTWNMKLRPSDDRKRRRKSWKKKIEVKKLYLNAPTLCHRAGWFFFGSTKQWSLWPSRATTREKILAFFRQTGPRPAYAMDQGAAFFLFCDILIISIFVKHIQWLWRHVTKVWGFFFYSLYLFSSFMYFKESKLVNYIMCS